MRGATPRASRRKEEQKGFQSTLPVRGATIAALKAVQAAQISIHAPREGSDHEVIQPFGAQVISIHAPREGSDCRMGVELSQTKISIHAPREGSDHRYLIPHARPPYFNPRSP